MYLDPLGNRREEHRNRAKTLGLATARPNTSKRRSGVGFKV